MREPRVARIEPQRNPEQTFVDKSRTAESHGCSLRVHPGYNVRNDHGRHHHPDPAQQDREPGRGDALSFLSLGLFHHHPRVARLLLRDPRPRRPADRRAADVLPRAGLSPSGRPHPRALRRRRRSRDGDVFVSNHPYEGGLPHVSDMAFVAPVFADGKIVAFSGSIAHKADVGGTVPGSTSANATEMFHEGLLLPPIKIWDARRSRCRTSSASSSPTAASPC